jgi:hypothetical protein
MTVPDSTLRTLPFSALQKTAPLVWQRNSSLRLLDIAQESIATSQIHINQPRSVRASGTFKLGHRAANCPVAE